MNYLESQYKAGFKLSPKVSKTKIVAGIRSTRLYPLTSQLFLDPTAFFENFYKEKLKMLDNIIPNITTTGCKLNHLKGDISLDKECLKNISIIGQVDNKFIAAIKEDDKLLLLFDQHAVDERIRLEKLSKGIEDIFY